VNFTDFEMHLCSCCSRHTGNDPQQERCQQLNIQINQQLIKVRRY